MRPRERRGRHCRHRPTARPRPDGRLPNPRPARAHRPCQRPRQCPVPPERAIHQSARCLESQRCLRCLRRPRREDSAILGAESASGRGTPCARNSASEALSVLSASNICRPAKQAPACVTRAAPAGRSCVLAQRTRQTAHSSIRAGLVGALHGRPLRVEPSLPLQKRLHGTRRATENALVLFFTCLTLFLLSGLPLLLQVPRRHDVTTQPVLGGRCNAEYRYHAHTIGRLQRTAIRTLAACTCARHRALLPARPSVSADSGVSADLFFRDSTKGLAEIRRRAGADAKDLQLWRIVRVARNVRDANFHGICIAPAHGSARRSRTGPHWRPATHNLPDSRPLRRQNPHPAQYESQRTAMHRPSLRRSWCVSRPSGRRTSAAARADGCGQCVRERRCDRQWRPLCSVNPIGIGHLCRLRQERSRVEGETREQSPADAVVRFRRHEAAAAADL